MSTPIEPRDYVRSYDVDEDWPAYVEGPVVAILDGSAVWTAPDGNTWRSSSPCPCYVIRVLRRITPERRGGALVGVERPGLVKAQPYACPPLNGTPTTLGGVCNGVVRVARWYQVEISEGMHGINGGPEPRPERIAVRCLTSPERRSFRWCAPLVQIELEVLDVSPVWPDGVEVGDEHRAAWADLLMDGEWEPYTPPFRNIFNDDGTLKEGVTGVFQDSYSPDKEGDEEARDYASGNHLV